MTAGIEDVLPAVAARLGIPGAADEIGLPELAGVRKVAVVLVDGLGYHLLPRLAGHAPLLAAVLAGEHGRLIELCSAFPSTTPTNLVSLATGVRPGEHGVLGFTVNVPDSDRVLVHIAWRDDPPPASWQPVPTWYQRAVAAGVPAAAVLPAMFAGSGLTEAAYRGARFHGVGRKDDYPAQLLAAIEATPGLIYGYTAALDTAAHLHGIASEQWTGAAAAVDRLLARITEGLPTDAALLVTADHGGLDIPADRRVDLSADPRLTSGLRVVAGEPRVRYLHTVPGAVADVLATWRAVLGDQATVLAREEAIAQGLFGAVPPAHAARIGDVVVICRDDLAVLASGHEPPEVAKLVGFHGALTPAETAIPLIVLRR